MISNQNDLISFIDSLLSTHNFVKKGNNWYYRTGECIVIFGIEKSKWSGQFGTVLTALVRAIEDTEFPKTHQCHIHGLGLKVLVKNGDELKGGLDLEKKFENEVREKIISKALTETAIPFLLKLSTVDGIRDAIKEYVDLKYYITLKLKNHLGLPPTHSR